MGLSSSQARLLNLTSRMHQIEYKAAKLEAEKLQMANESRRVYDDYLYALEKTKIQGKVLSTDGSITYIDATYQSMLDRGYQIKFEGDDRVVVTQATADNFEKAGDSRNYFIALQTGRIDENGKAPDGVYEIYTAEQLMNMTTGRDYRLMSNIDMSGKNWTSKSLSGKTFDGNGYSITGLNNALFDNINGGTVKNLRVSGNVSDKSVFANNIGSDTTISDVSVGGTLNRTNETRDDVGGFASTVMGSNITISNCNSSVNVNCTYDSDNNTYDTGCFIGYAKGTGDKNSIVITNCSSSGSVSAYGGSNGGFIGHATNSTITNCSSTSNVTGNNHMAGFIGYISSCDISDCVASGRVTINDTGKSKAIAAAGFGTVENVSNITNCSFFGSITGDTSGNSSAFIDSYTTSVTNCYTSVPITPNMPFNRVGPGSNAPAPSNKTSVTPPSIKHTTSVDDPNGDGALYDEMKQYGYILEGSEENPATGHENDVTWFTNMVLAGMLFIFAPDRNGKDGFTQVSVATDTNLQEVADESLLKKAEAKYEADMLKIDRKDRKYDYDLAALDAERNAIKQEMDTLKTVAKENVDRTFRLFS